MGCDEPMFGDVRFTMLAWGFGFQGLVCLGTSISTPLLLGDLLGVDLLGSVRQGCADYPNKKSNVGHILFNYS